MRTVACPSCNGKVSFQSGVSIFAVCPYCRSMIVRRDLDVECIGTMGILPPDTSPIQIGTQGSYRGTGFVIVGRLRQTWSEGGWNEWCAWFHDGRYGWLAEAQGFWMLSFEAETPKDLPPAEELGPDLEVRIGKVKFVVDDIKEVVCAGSEGELPFPAPQGRKAISIDLSGPSKEYACIEYADDETRLSLGQYVEFAELRLSFLRQLDGW